MDEEPAVGVLAIMKNESMNVLEWLDHYFWIGVDRIFLIDNGSDDNSVALAKSHSAHHKIDLIEKPEQHKQIAHYRSAMTDLDIRNRVDWLFVADLDEFWFMKSSRNIKNVFRQYQNVDLVYTNWTVFGSSGLDRHPSSIRREFLSKRPKLAPHENSKWLVRTAAMKSDDIVYTHKVREMDSRRVISDNVDLQLNHYVTQSREYFATVKMTRGDASNTNSDSFRDWAYFDRYEAACTTTDTILRDMLASSNHLA